MGGPARRGCRRAFQLTQHTVPAPAPDPCAHPPCGPGSRTSSPGPTPKLPATACPPRPARRGDPARPARSGRHPRLPPNPGLAHRRRPGGLVALAIPHSHLRTALVYEGYAARSRDGIHELIDIETVRAVADTVDDLQAAASPARPPGAPSRQPPAPSASRAPSSMPPPPAASSPTTTPCCARTRKRSRCATTSAHTPCATALESATPRGSITACPNIRSPGVHRDSSAAESDVAWSTTRGCV